MLIDDLLDVLREEHQGADPIFTDAIKKMAGKASNSLLKSQRFVLSPKVCAAVDDMIDPKAVKSSLPHLFLPAVSTWLEWDSIRGLFGGGRVGVLIEGKDIYSGTIYAYSRRSISKGGLDAALYEWEADFDFKGDPSGMFMPDGRLKVLNDGTIEGLVPALLDMDGPGGPEHPQGVRASSSRSLQAEQEPWQASAAAVVQGCLHHRQPGSGPDITCRQWRGDRGTALPSRPHAYADEAW